MEIHTTAMLKMFQKPYVKCWLVSTKNKIKKYKIK